MQTRSTTLLALLTAALVSATNPAPSAPLPGPGSVAGAVQSFLRRLDQGGDARALLADRRRDIDFVLDADGALQVSEVATTPSFVDVAADGTSIAATTADAFAAQLIERATTSAPQRRVVRTEVRGLHCSCDSERCGLAVVEFDRVCAVGGGKQERVPMRATALLEYVGGDGVSWRIHHWHASRAVPAPSPARDRGK